MERSIENEFVYFICTVVTKNNHVNSYFEAKFFHITSSSDK